MMMDKNEDAHYEDTTMYGEFVPSFHVWLTPEKQKETAERLANLKDQPIKKRLQ